jgi:glycosyltransferase involved in cell wall biosynthesis
MKVWMFVYNNCRHDARVLKEAKTLAEAEHDVRIIAVLDKDTEPYEGRDGFRILRVDASLPGGHPATAEGTPPSPRGRSATTMGRKLLGYLFRRPLDFIHARAKDRMFRLLRRLPVKVCRSFAFFQYYRRAWGIVKNQPGDIYHCHDLDTLLLGYMAKRRHGGRLVYDAHELTTELAYISRPEKMGWCVLERFLIRRADEVIATGTYRGEYLVKKYRVASPSVILNCPPLPAAEVHNRALREKLGLADDTVPVILYQGVFSGGRGLDKLVLAAAHLDRGVLVLMGWGALEAELRSLVEKKGLEERVYFTEPVGPDRVVYYCMSASVGVVIVLHTSLNNYYATPNKLYEYISAGLPVVSSDFPALKEVVEGYGLGCTFDPEEPESIAAAINLVLAGEQRYDTMRKNALEAARIFNWENESKKLLEIYRRLSHHFDDRTA